MIIAKLEVDYRQTLDNRPEGSFSFNGPIIKD